MTELDLIALGLLALGALIGFLRGLQKLEREVLWLIAVPAIAALICLVIVTNKAGPALSGVVGLVSGFVLMSVAGGLLVGIAVGQLLRRWHGWVMHPAGKWQKWADRIIIYGLSAAGVVLSLMEESGAPGSYH